MSIFAPIAAVAGVLAVAYLLWWSHCDFKALEQRLDLITNSGGDDDIWPEIKRDLDIVEKVTHRQHVHALMRRKDWRELYAGHSQLKVDSQ